MVVFLVLTATALAAGYLVNAYSEWERKNAPPVAARATGVGQETATAFSRGWTATAMAGMAGTEGAGPV